MNMPETHTEQKSQIIVSCGILKNEIELILAGNKEQTATRFLDSSLHNDLDKLSRTLTTALEKEGEETRKLVIYGTCHPQIDEIVNASNAIRTQGQNCVELLLGRQRFTEELSNGAFFLFEDWARRWEQISYRFFGNWELMKEIFQDSHTYILCIRTPCSGDYSEYASRVSERTGLPLVWEDFDLSRLESVITQSLSELSLVPD